MNNKFSFLLIAMIALVSLLGCTQTKSNFDGNSLSGAGYSFYSIDLNVIDGTNVLFSENFAFDAEHFSEDFSAFETTKLMLDNNLEYAEYDFGVFITSILGVTPKENEFWSLYINGEKAAMGISSYNISDVNLIEFKLEELQTF